MKVGRIKDPLYKDFYLGITPPTFILPFEAPDQVEHEELRCRIVAALEPSAPALGLGA